MASDSLDTRRKHRRRSSSPEEVDRSSKRPKHRHHRHRHHHGTKKRGEERKYDVETVEGGHTPDADLGSDSHRPEDDVEEGEILEEEGLGGRDGEIGKKETESDAESGEIQVTEDKPNLGLFNKKTSFHKEGDSVGINGKDSKNNGEDISSNKFVTSPAMDGEDGGSHQSHVGSSNRSSVDPQDGSLGNGYLKRKSSKEDKKQKGNEKLKGNYDEEGLEVNGFEVSMRRNSSSESAREKYRTLRRSPSCDRHRSQSRSSGHTRDRSRSHSIVEYVHSKRRHSREHETISYTGRDNADYDVDEEMKVKYSRNHGRGSRGLEVDDPMEHGTSYSSIYTGKEDRHYRRESRDRGRSKERDADRDFRRESERERSRNRELDRVSRREKERERSHERDRREVEKDRGRRREVDRDSGREKERDRSWDTVVERGRRREKERGSRDRTRVGERDRDRESDLDDKNWDRDRMKERERRDDRNRHKDRDIENDKNKHLVHKEGHDSQDTYRHSRHSRQGETEHHRDRRRTSQNSCSHVSNSLERGEDKIERGEDEQDDLDEKLQLAEQEEEDLIRIKEESRRRREAILEKYKQQQQQQVEQVPENEDKDKEHVDVPTAVPEMLDCNNDGVDVYEAEISFAIGKSPRQYVNADTEKIAGAGGLGEGTPKSERSGDNPDDKFCDDIFGETPTGVRKSGKGDGLRIDRGGLYDNWDDAEGYYSYRFGEILDGRYEVTAAHGRGVFSTVVRAKSLKSGNGEPEEVAIKIIRNNDTMYKAGMDELVILKKLVGADPDDKRHCVRFLSSFKYRNHLCLVFESLNMNLREVLKKFGRNIGLRLTAVRAYAKQLFIALKHLRNCGVLHCDIKPDNMLVNEAKNVLKLCDFGNAMFAGKNEVTPYLVSRFYRAPEIILGLPYDHPLDMWSVGCCLYELYTGKVLFPGPTNNEMLRLHMELKGPFPKKMLRKGAFIEQHFDQDLNFLATDEDPVTKKTLKRVIVNIKSKDIGTMITGSPGEDPKMLANFKDLLEKIFVLDPEKRLTVSQALNHPFITGK